MATVTSWNSNYTAPTANSTFGGKVVSANYESGGFGVADAIQLSGHRTVSTKAELYKIPTQILSSNNSNDSKNTTGTDAIGQLWYVQEDKKFYRLKDYSNHDNVNGWEESILSLSMSDYTADKSSSSGDIINVANRVSTLENAYTYQKSAYSWTQDQITSIQTTLNTLVNNVLFRSTSGTNTYLWTGTLAEFNALTTKASNTTFIITDA
jgi:hypothetical protein